MRSQTQLRIAEVLEGAVWVCIGIVLLLLLAGCFPPVPLGALGGGSSAPPPSITVSPHIYLVGQDGTLTVSPADDDDTTDSDGGVDTSTPADRGGADQAPPRSTPAPADPRLMLRMPPEGGAGPEAALETDSSPDLAATLREAEGFSATVYPDPNGVPHIGYGHRITPAEADALLAADMASARAAAERVVGEPTWGGLSETRRDVLVEMAYLVGETGLAGFARMLDALRAGDFDAAADEIVASRLGGQVPTRTARLAATLREG